MESSDLLITVFFIPFVAFVMLLHCEEDCRMMRNAKEIKLVATTSLNYVFR